MLARKALSRKALFVAALAQAEMTASAWAENEGGISKTQLYRTLRDPKNSAPLTAKIDAFIKEHVGNRTTALAS